MNEDKRPWYQVATRDYGTADPWVLIAMNDGNDQTGQFAPAHIRRLAEHEDPEAAAAAAVAKGYFVAVAVARLSSVWKKIRVPLIVLVLLGGLAACSRDDDNGPLLPSPVVRTWEIQSNTEWSAWFNTGTPAMVRIDGHGDFSHEAIDRPEACATVIKFVDGGFVRIVLMPDGKSAETTDYWKAVGVCIPDPRFDE